MEPRSTLRRKLAVDVAASFLVLIAPLLNKLISDEYGLWSPEVGLVLLVAIIAAT